ncbi:MAG: hypothetical protein WDA71_07520 [Actinomycetota bacterium]
MSNSTQEMNLLADDVGQSVVQDGGRVLCHALEYGHARALQGVISPSGVGG